MRPYAGVIDLVSLYRFVEEHPDCYMPPRTAEAKKSLRAYASCCSSLTNSVPEHCGVYLWGHYNKKGLWKNIYLGFAGFGKTASLRARINEELRDERCCIWASVLGKEKILAIQDVHQKHRERSLPKAGAEHIIWAAMVELANDEVRDVESDLIEALNPTANLLRPAPPHRLQKSSGDIFKLLRRQIHASRPPDTKRAGGDKLVGRRKIKA